MITGRDLLRREAARDVLLTVRIPCAAIAGIVLLARTVAQRHVRRQTVDVGFAPARGGATMSLVGRF